MSPPPVDLVHNAHERVSARRLTGREQILRVLTTLSQIHQHDLCFAVRKARPIDAFQRT